MKFKKVLLPLITGALALSLAACGEDDKAAKDEKPEAAGQEEMASAEEMQAKLAEQQVEKDKIVAIVNDEELKGEQYNATLSSIQGQMQQMGQDPSSKESAEQVKMQTLDTVVNQTLILQKAKEEKITPSESEIDQKYAEFVEQFGDEKTMKEALKSQNMNVRTVKEQIIAKSIIFEKYQDKFTPAEKVTDKEIKEYYDQAAAQNKESGQELPPLEEVSDEIKSMIEQEQQQKKLAAHVEELKAEADIKLKI
ncbi:SurA N-terminal domain-containing protein [Sporosarcina sp. 6E9]|uniref:SurA N-terminal domain-containing protein n=1 Tax=Sporosarcina sp. 6E9 TaxID=2819235 RepID=UPI001B317804|nr:SurA N-terminal domain-containing protein [Sporosarcina sp. 6E9]